MSNSVIVVMTASLVANLLKASGERLTIGGITGRVNQKGATLNRALKSLYDDGFIQKVKSRGVTYYFHVDHADKHVAELEKISKRQAEKAKARKYALENKARRDRDKKRADEIKKQMKVSSRWLGSCKLLRVLENSTSEMRFYKWVGNEISN